jgi:hypothetical protein
MQEAAYPKKKEKCVAGQFAAVKYTSETYFWTKKLKREDYGVDKYWGTCCCKRINTVEKQ